MRQQRFKRFLVFVSIFTCSFSVVWIIFENGFEPYVTLLGSITTLVGLVWSERKTTENKIRLSQRFILQVLSALTLGVSTAWLFHEQSFTTVAGFFTGILTFGVALLAPDDPISLSPDIIQRIRNDKDDRRKLLQLTRRIWIEESLHLELEYLPNMPVHFIHYHDASDTGGAPSSQKVNIPREFNKIRRCLLLLGEPGIGKTTALLQLLDDLLRKCESNLSRPLPVKLSLITWQENEKNIKEWIIDELVKQYKVTKTQAQIWVLEDGRLVLLLDGLDELSEKTRNSCTVMLNAFGAEMPNTKVIITCRTADYELLQEKPAADSILELAPLSKSEALDYLATHHVPPDLRRLVEHDNQLLDLITVRLFLGLLCKFKNTDRLRTYLTANQRADKGMILALFVDQSLEEKTDWKPRQKQGCRSFLTWLAQGLDAHHTDILFLERMQLSWLSSKTLSRINRLAAILASTFIWSIFSSIVGVVAWLVSLVLLIRAGSLDIEINGNVVAPLLVIAVGYAMSGIVGLFYLITYSLLSRKIEPAEKLEFTISNGLRGALVGAVISGALSLVCTQATNLLYRRFLAIILDQGLTYSSPTYMIEYFVFIAVYALAIVCASCIFTFLFARIFKNANAFSIRKIVAMGALLGISGAGFGGWIGGTVNVGEAVSSDFLRLAFWIGMIAGGFSGLVVGGISPSQFDEKFLVRNILGKGNTGMRLSLRNALIMTGLGSILSVALSSVLAQQTFQMGFYGDVDQTTSFIVSLLVFGSIFGIVVCPILAFSFGFYDVVVHYILRIFLRLARHVPFHLLRYLMSVSETGVLRRTGNGFRFRHPLFQEYFAGMTIISETGNKNN